MPMQRDRYPDDWEAISQRIRFERARGCCEWCGVQNGVSGYRDRKGKFWTEEEIWMLDGGDPDDGPPMRPVTIVLTVAHLGTPHPDGTPGDKHDKMDVREENLAALCQRCHLNYDRDEHKANAAETRRRKRLAAGQTELAF